MSERSKAEERLIRVMTKRGGKGFRILRSAETTIKQFVRPIGVKGDGHHRNRANYSY